MHHISILDHLGGQLSRLCPILGMESETPRELLAGILGPYGERPLSEPPGWPSGIADDHSPIEFSIAYNDTEPPALRILAEVPGTPPGLPENMSAAFGFLADQTARFGLSVRRLDAVRDLFTVEQPQGDFGAWCSLVFRSGRAPEFKVYLNPQIAGPDRAPDLVAGALRRLDMGASYRAILAHAVRSRQPGRADRLTFFALDLHEGPQARVKLYMSHYGVEATDVARTAAVVDHADPAEIVEFCTSIGGRGPFDARPLVGSYTLTEGTERPVGYSVYVPIRSYVGDDQEARDRVAAALRRRGFDPALLDRALAAVTTRSLADGRGLIAHVSLRVGRPRPGVTVYLSAEAHAVRPPARSRGPRIDRRDRTAA